MKNEKISARTQGGGVADLWVRHRSGVIDPDRPVALDTFVTTDGAHKGTSFLNLTNENAWDLIDALTEIVGPRPEPTLFDKVMELPVGTVFRLEPKPPMTPVIFVRLTDDLVFRSSMLGAMPISTLKDWDAWQDATITIMHHGVTS